MMEKSGRVRKSHNVRAKLIECIPCSWCFKSLLSFYFIKGKKMILLEMYTAHFLLVCSYCLKNNLILQTVRTKIREQIFKK